MGRMRRAEEAGKYGGGQGGESSSITMHHFEGKKSLTRPDDQPTQDSPEIYSSMSHDLE